MLMHEATRAVQADGYVSRKGHPMHASSAPQLDRDRREREAVGQKRTLGRRATGHAAGAILDALCRVIEDRITRSACSILLREEAPARLARGADPASDSPQPGGGAWLSVPILDPDSRQHLGVFLVDRHAADPPSDEERIVVQEAAAIAGLALRQASGQPERLPNGTPVARREPPRLPPATAPDDLYRRLVESVPAITYALQVGATTAATYVSPQVATILGWRPDEYLADPDHWFAKVHPDDQERVRAAMRQAIATRLPLNVEYRVTTPSDGLVWLRDSAVLAEERAEGVQVWHGVQIDITAEKANEHRLHTMAFYDALTGLPNRRHVTDHLRSALSASERPNVAILFLDLDGFKFINDGFGHAGGDELLVAVARRLASRVAGHGSLARFGGDEFVAVLQDATAHDVRALAEAMLATLRRPFLINGYALSVDGTIGIAISSPELATPETLLRAADRALYRAKANGRGVYAVYDVRIDQPNRSLSEQEAELRRGLEAGEFEIAYQPVVDIASRRILAVEALLRWNHPERGTLRASEFLAVADETGFIIPLGRWVIEEACRQMKAWQTRYPALGDLQVSVNLSGRQFRHAGLAEEVAEALRKTGLSPASLALEVKEADALSATVASAATVNEIKQLGVRVTIDDFGRGWTAIDSLTRFSIDDLKLDGSYVLRLGQRHQDVDVVRALVGMARAIGMDVTAGGVESGEQLAMLHALGCARAQGLHLAPPLRVEEMDALFERGDSVAGDSDQG